MDWCHAPLWQVRTSRPQSSFFVSNSYRLAVCTLPFVMLFLSFDAPLARAASAAQWLGESSFTASSLETGQIGYLEAWGGPYFGYSYRYSLSGAPAGVAVDTDTGMLSLQVPLSAGRYTFNAIVGNRKDSASSTFPVILDVVQGVTPRRTADQILHKTYAVDSGNWGTPDGLDYTAVLLNLRQAIVNDQAAAGDGNLRATVVFGAGKEYRYTNNRWPWGIQFLALQSDVPGTRAALRNVIRSTKHDADLYVIQSARGFYSCHQVTGNPIGDCSKAVTYWINPTTIGSNTITLKNAVDAANLRIGRYHIIGDYDQQMYGFPPNSVAQQPKVPTIGVLVVGSPGSEQFWQLFRDGMRELGYDEGRNVRFEFRSDEGQVSRLPELAADLVRLKVDVIVTWFTPAGRAAKQAERNSHRPCARRKSGRNRTR
jgi:hypothetical protein